MDVVDLLIPGAPDARKVVHRLQRQLVHPGGPGARAFVVDLYPDRGPSRADRYQRLVPAPAEVDVRIEARVDGLENLPLVAGLSARGRDFNAGLIEPDD